MDSMQNGRGWTFRIRMPELAVICNWKFSYLHSTFVFLDYMIDE